jgi:hypothetical protein
VYFAGETLTYNQVVRTIEKATGGWVLNLRHSRRFTWIAFMRAVAVAHKATRHNMVSGPARPLSLLYGKHQSL